MKYAMADIFAIRLDERLLSCSAYYCELMF